MAFEREAQRTHFLLLELSQRVAALRMAALNLDPASFGKHMFTQHSRLFHYTTIPGLVGIVEKQSLWLTNTLYMNDLSEQKYALHLIKNTISSLRLSNRYSERFNDILACDSYECNNAEAAYSSPAYVACFTDNGDSLPMWGMYGNTAGVSIEFDLNSDYNFVFGPNCFFENILYDDDILKSAVTSIIDEYYNEYKKDESCGDTGYLERISDVYKHEIFGSVFHYSINFKHAAFHNEKETRLHYMPKDNQHIQFRIKNNFIVSYVEMPPKELNQNKKLPISSVTIGPSIEQKLLIKSVYDFMKAKEYNIEVKASSIPYIGR